MNDTKAAIHQDEITFTGHRIAAEGVQPDRSKAAAILDMPPPIMSTEFEHFAARFSTVPNSCQTSPVIWNQSGHCQRRTARGTDPERVMRH